MIENFSWVLTGKLAGSALPGHFQYQEEGLRFDLNQLYDLGVRCLVSVLELDRSFERLCRRAGLDWLYLPIDDFSVPSDDRRFSDLVDSILSRIETGNLEITVGASAETIHATDEITVL